MLPQTYAPSEVTVSIASLYEIAGFSPGSIVSITKDAALYSTQKGATGGVERTHISDATYTLEITLSQTSPSNTVLNALSAIDDVTRSAAFPVFVKDSSGNSIFFAASCWIESPPSASYSNTHQDRTWSIKCTEMVFGIGGNGVGTSEGEVQIAQLASLLSQFGNNLGVI
ncbi:MAG: hypothetical protein CMF22_10030 [Idiomarinaceae bacterium]|nr:hypothetical protein [Idiomarinaceae bacterium]|tara:strand:+ start:60179 stop:60688 length:510 start_codon:yes stop_codon:yes gene_type:complete